MTHVFMTMPLTRAEREAVVGVATAAEAALPLTPSARLELIAQLLAAAVYDGAIANCTDRDEQARRTNAAINQVLLRVQEIAADLTAQASGIAKTVRDRRERR